MRAAFSHCGPSSRGALLRRLVMAAQYGPSTRSLTPTPQRAPKRFLPSRGQQYYSACAQSYVSLRRAHAQLSWLVTLHTQNCKKELLPPAVLIYCTAEGCTNKWLYTVCAYTLWREFCVYSCLAAGSDCFLIFFQSSCQ